MSIFTSEDWKSLSLPTNRKKSLAAGVDRSGTSAIPSIFHSACSYTYYEEHVNDLPRNSSLNTGQEDTHRANLLAETIVLTEDVSYRNEINKLHGLKSDRRADEFDRPHAIKAGEKKKLNFIKVIDIKLPHCRSSPPISVIIRRLACTPLCPFRQNWSYQNRHNRKIMPVIVITRWVETA